MKRRCTAVLLAALLCLIVVPHSTQAQTPSWQHQVVFNSGPQFATGDFGDAYKTGLAIDAGYYYRATDNLFVGAYGGYQQFKGGSGNPADLNIIPINLALKYNFSLTGIQPYIAAEGGPFFVTNGSSTTEIGLAPRIGVRVPLSRGIDLDLNLKYNVIFQEANNLTYVGANGGFAYILDRANIQYR